MHIIAVFNSISHSNIGFETFINQPYSVKKTIVLLLQSRQAAQVFLGERHPNVEVDILSMRSDPFGSIARLGRINRRRAVVHTHHAAAALVGLSISFLLNVPFMITAHANYATYKFKHRALLYIPLRCAAMVVANSFSTLESLSALNLKRVTVIYNGVDFSLLDTASVSVSEGHAVDNPFADTLNRAEVITIGTVCRLVPVKDLATLIHGFAIAKSRVNRELMLVIVGEGEEAGALRELSERYDLSGAVAFTGALPRYEVYQKVINMDIFAVTSLTEGFCNAMVEAASAGVPIVASDIPPLVEVMGEGNAKFFTPGDSYSLAETLVCLVSDAVLRQELAKRGQARTRSAYSLQNCIDAYGAEYSRLVFSEYE